ncbi:MAG: hypothetical protein ACXV5F_10625 [Halobacteriota archaeon]
MASGIVINSVRDALAVASQILEAAQQEVVWLIPPSLVPLLVRFNFASENITPFLQRGGVSRGIIPLSYANIEAMQTSLSRGEDVRHSDEVHEMFMLVGDRHYSVSAINIGAGEYTLDTPIVAFWNEDPTYAEYLLTSFENAWSHAVPAAQRIEELVAQGREQR